MDKKNRHDHYPFTLLVRDASRKLGSGIYNGNRAWFGLFSEFKNYLNLVTAW